MNQEIDTDGSERRNFPRYNVNLPVRFSSEMLDFDATCELWDGLVEDISRTGLFIRSDLLEVPGTPVCLSLRMPIGEQTLFLNGRVAWIMEHPPKGPGMGIQLRDGPIGEKLFNRLFHGTTTPVV
jgi:Tfp pilus assembly protein PilZ